MLPKSVLFNEITIRRRLRNVAVAIAFDFHLDHKTPLHSREIYLFKSLLFGVFHVQIEFHKKYGCRQSGQSIHPDVYFPKQQLVCRSGIKQGVNKRE